MEETDVRLMLLAGVARLAKGSKPTAKWLAMWQRTTAPLSPEDVRAWCRGAWANPGDRPDDPTPTAAFWGIASVAGRGTPAMVADQVLGLQKAGFQREAHAAVWALGAMAAQTDPLGASDGRHHDMAEEPEVANEAIGQLQRLQSRIKHRTTARAIDRALEHAAANRGLDREALQDLVVLDAGLDAAGTLSWSLGPHEMVVFLAEDGAVELAFFERASGRALGAAPKAIREGHYGTWQQARAMQKALAEALATQKQRLESALESQRVWRVAQWERVFSAHPLMNHLATRLIWELLVDGEPPRGLARENGAWLDAAGQAFNCPPNASLRLAHPAALAAADLAAWRAHVVERRLVQPFKQVFRETYRPSAEDLAIGAYTDRFAGVVVRHRQMYALLRGRGWSGLSGIGELGYQGAKALVGLGVSAMIGFRSHRHFQDPQRRQVVLDQLEFYADPAPEVGGRVPLSAVPPVAFSEAVRDIALVVGVAGLGPEPGRARSRALGPDAARDDSREALVSALLPLLGLEDRVELTGPFARLATGGHAFLLDLRDGHVTLEADGRAIDLDGIALTESPLYLPHEGADAATASVLSTLVWLAQFGHGRIRLAPDDGGDEDPGAGADA